MSATLTWFNSGLGTKTGTTAATMMDDIETLMNSKSGDANFSWQIASKNNSVDPRYVVLKRKDGSAGRILFVNYTAAPGTWNSGLFFTQPATNSSYIAWFPSGNVDTPHANLTAASGTIMGNDTNLVKASGSFPIATIYAASVQPFFFDSAEALILGFGNPGSATTYFQGAGKLVVDANDDAYDAVISPSTNPAQNVVVTNSSTFQWQAASASIDSSTSTSGVIRVNYGTNNSRYFFGFAPSSAWYNQTLGTSNDPLTDTSLNKAWFVPMVLMGTGKGGGFPLKLRQMAYGPISAAAFAAYSSTGPVVQARMFNHTTAGGSSFWCTNFKL